jgi:oligopeptide transport system substrate-binding protein
VKCRSVILSFIIAVTATGFFGCGTNDSDARNVFRYNETTGIASLDPAFAKNQSVIWAIHQLYNTLVETDANLNIVPSLAYRWEVSDDRRQYRFFLRNDVFFHDDPAFPEGRGRRMTAHDVEYSLRRIVDPATASSGAWIFNNRVDATSGFRAVNDSIFELKLLRPFTPILGLLSMQYCSVVPREVVNKWGKDFRSHPCGTGPFRFGQWVEGQALTFMKNDRYFETDTTGQRLPYLDAVKVTFFNNKATEFLLFRQDKLDFINDIDPSFKDEILNKKGMLHEEWNGKLVLSKHPYLNTEYLGILVGDKQAVNVLNQKLVRQAMNYGFDRRKMMMYLRNSIGLPAESGFVPAGLPSFDSTSVVGYRYNPVLAAKLLERAGFPQGRGLPVITLLTIPIYSDLASFIARQLEDIGVRIKVEVVQKAFLLEQTAQSKASFFRGSWIADYPDAENYLSVFYGKNPAPPNYTRYNNPEFDRLYENALATTDDTARMKMYQQMDRILIEDAPVIPLWYDEVIRIVQPGLKGFDPNGLNLLELRRVRKR